MNTAHRISVGFIASIALAASAAAPSHAVEQAPASEAGANDIDPCWLLGPLWGEHC
ncbi:hypothetical protein K0651_08420 [Ornithinimicrobium sp. Arc0846-15]|nr:hypothetical protein [Ornithinimicrobium laminariae]